ncbi:MAG: hypothetical protein GY941_12180 [Planctomycetes bacterium]|nr:hypothetical protein [Planctomycetota bacterium]
MDYVAQDCRLTLDIAEASEKNKKIGWITRRGTKSFFDLPAGWLTVEEACKPHLDGQPVATIKVYRLVGTTIGSLDTNFPQPPMKTRDQIDRHQIYSNDEFR